MNRAFTPFPPVTGGFLTSGIHALAASMIALFAAACATPPSPSGIVVSNVTVISPERPAPLEHAYVRIRDGKIAEVSERPLRGVQEIDGTGHYLVPGLIDSHVHLAVPPGFPAGMTAEEAAAHPGIVAAALAQEPRSYLFFGFTTVVDLVGTRERTERWNACDVRPDAFFCGGAVILNDQFRRVLYPFFSYAVSLDERIPPATDPAGQTPEAIVARIAADGAIGIKTFYDRYAGMTPTLAQARALVAAAGARGLPVFIHANRKEGQALAVAAGMDVIAHGLWRDNEDPALDDEARELLASIARDKIGYQPTTQVIAAEPDMRDDDYFSRPELADVYPRALLDWYAGALHQNTHWSRVCRPGADARVRGTLVRAAEVTRTLAAADARLLFGSDTPSDRIYTNPPGLNGRLEMNHWIGAGVSLEKLFRALTIDNARMLRLDREIGTIEPRKTANLLLLGANPLKTIEAYDRIETVFLHGRPLQRGSLSARNAAGVEPGRPRQN